VTDPTLWIIRTDRTRAAGWLRPMRSAANSPSKSAVRRISSRRSTEEFAAAWRRDQIVDLAALAGGEYSSRAPKGFSRRPLFAQLIDGAWTNGMERHAPRAVDGLREGSAAKQPAKIVCAAGDAHIRCRRTRRLTDFYTSIHHATAVGRMMRPIIPCAEPIAGFHRLSRTQLVSRVSGQTFPQTRDSGFRRARRNPFGPSSRSGLRTRARSLHRPSVTRRGCRSDGGRRGAHLGVCLSMIGRRAIASLGISASGVFPGKNFATTISPGSSRCRPLLLSRSLRAARRRPPPCPNLDSSWNRDAGQSISGWTC